jgi:4-diphosphocytidyl-2-C-methyl-D-erythritol kinase
VRSQRGQTLTEFAPAKINLTLRVLRRREDGYHELESLVVFAAVGDRVSLTAGPDLELAVAGPTAASSGAAAENLVLRAAQALALRVPGLTLGRFRLVKRLPVAAGLGGGSADAAAALRLLARSNRLAPADARLQDAAAATGADVPVCLDPRPRMMRGIGELLSEPLDLPPLPAVLVNPRAAVATADVFAALNLAKGSPPQTHAPLQELPAEREALLCALRQQGNDLEEPAIWVQPAISDVLAALRVLRNARLVRMSGSGATCFALFDSRAAASTAARQLRAARPDWWIRATTLGGI